MLPLWGGYAFRPWLCYSYKGEHPATEEYVYQNFHKNDYECNYDFHPSYEPEEKPYACFNKLMDYGERHLYDEMKNDFFAVSLPDFLIFDDDMDQKNKAHCHYLMGLANLGFADHAEAKKQFEQALTYDYNHQNCRIYLEMCVG